jgi:ABC-type Fe3+-citrate transport system substrate-binding protein
VRKTSEEDAISKQLLQTAAILSSSNLAETFGMGIKAVTSISTGLEKDEDGQGKKEKNKLRVSEEELEEIKQKEKKLLREAFKSLDLCQ